MYFQNQTFLVFGLSRSGESATKFLLNEKANVYIYDETSNPRMEKLVSQLTEKGAKTVKKEELSQISEKCDALVLSPGIAIDHPLAVAFKRNKKAVIGETELCARMLRCPVVAITGTNGKTTSVSMLEKVLQEGGFYAKACGNIGTPMLDYLYLNDEKNAVAVAEISSFQLETLNSLVPHIAVILNITQDHLNRHYNMDNYVFLKGKLLKNLSELEYAVLNYDDETVRALAQKTKAKIIWFSVRERINGGYYENGELWFNGERILSEKEFPLEGVHNIENALACICVAKILGVDNQTIKNALVSFKGIKHRIQEIAVVDGVTYVDDSKGTNVDATIKAIACMKKETVLLLGGKHKGYDYAPLFTAIPSSRVVHAVLYGENRYALLKSAREQGFEKLTVCDKFERAVRIARLLATPKQTVLLSPASASFDEFASYEERGDAFVEIVESFTKTKEETTLEGGALLLPASAIASQSSAPQNVDLDKE